MDNLPFGKPQRRYDPVTLEEVRKNPCSACGAWPTEVHHITSRGAGGDDTVDNCIALCRLHHQMWHVKGTLYMREAFPGIKQWLYEHHRMDVIDDDRIFSIPR